MKAILILLFTCLLVETAAQRKDVLIFPEKIFDFGNVKEDNGHVSHTFEFINGSDRPLKILSVRPSCGCTVPAWSKDVVPVGERGFVTATFDPKNRPGFFNKSLTITTDFDAESIVLTIKGTVVSNEDNTAYREANGSWRLLTSSFNMGKVWIKDEFSWKEFSVLNGGTTAISVQSDAVTPAYIKVEVVPTSIKPGEKGTIRIGYNGKRRNAYGFQSDNIEIITDDTLLPKKSFSVYATLENFFPELTEEEKKKAPKLIVSQQQLDMGRFSSNTHIEKKINIVNAGKKELNIHAIQPNCSCIVTGLDKTILPPGKSATLSVLFNADQRAGSQQKYITIYSNDPVNPVQRIAITAYIEKP